MSTRSNIGIEKKDGSIEAVYCHWDGYPGNNGKILDENYNTKAKAAKLVKTGIKKGGISSLNRTMATIDFFDEDDKDAKLTFDNETEYRKGGGAWIEYFYLFKKGQWYVSDGGGKFESLKNYAYAEGGEVKKDDKNVSKAQYVKDVRQQRKAYNKLKKEKGALRKENMELKKDKTEVKKEVKKEEADCKEEIKKTKKEIGKKVAKRFAEEEKDKKDWIKLQQLADKRADDCEREVEECEQEEGWLREDVSEEKGKRDEDATMLIGGLAGILLGIFLGRR